MDLSIGCHESTKSERHIEGIGQGKDTITGVTPAVLSRDDSSIDQQAEQRADPASAQRHSECGIKR